MTCTLQTWIGAYVLDALEPDETEEVRKHIADCPGCQDEVVQLAWIPAMLRTVSLAEVERLDEARLDEARLDEARPDDARRDDGDQPFPVRDRLSTSPTAARSARRWRRPVAALAGVLAAAAVAGAVVIQVARHTDRPHPVATRAVDPDSHVRAEVTLAERTWGTQLHLKLRGVAPGEHCSMVVHSRDGSSEVAASWVATYQGAADIAARTRLPIDRLAEVDVVAGNGRPLARLVIPSQAN